MIDLYYWTTPNGHKVTIMLEELGIPYALRGRHDVLQWLFWQMGNFGPMLGQNHHFGFYAEEKIPYAIDRYVKETSRLYAVLDRQLEGKEYLCGEYSIADMACYPWTISHERQKQHLPDFPNVMRWYFKMEQREAVERAYDIPEKLKIKSGIDKEAAKIMFGQDRSVVSTFE